MDLYLITVLASTAVSSALFALIHYVFLRAYIRTGVGIFSFFSLSFALLSLSQVAFVASNIVEESRLSLTLHSLSSSLALSAFLLMLYPLVREKSGEAVFTALPLFLISAPDFLTSLASLTVALSVKRAQLKWFLVALSATYFMRGAGVLFISSQIGIHLILLSELGRALATLVFAYYHLRRVAGY